MSNAVTPDSTAIPELPEKPQRGRGPLIGGVAAIAVVALAAGFGIGRATANSGSGSAAKTVTVRVGTTDASSDVWPILTRLAKAQGIDLQTVNFSDYTQANPALAQKQTDLNQFQHLQFLANYNVSAKQDLVPIGSTVVVPLPLYSKKHTKLDQIPQGGKIAIPNDATNQARALLVLQSAGLLKLKNGGNALSTPTDIDTSASKVSVVPVDAAQTVAALTSVDGSIINNNFALDAKLDPKSALFQDDPKSPAAEPYINVFVARNADKNNPTYLKVAQLWHSPEVIAAENKETKNTAVVVNRPESDLLGILTKLEKDISAS
ncbi:MetQ/NlpA family ABC transporter substrate-binding protein [Calidifontibacter terrae]